MPTIAVLAASGSRDASARELASLGAVEWHDDVGSLLDRAARGGLQAVVTGLDDEAGRSIAPALVALAARAPALPIVVHDRIDAATLPKLLAAAVTGFRMDFAVRPWERLAPIVQRVTSPDFRPGVAPVLLQRFAARAPPPLGVFVALAALSATAHRGAETVAPWTGVSLRTIERRLRGARWPAARTVLRSFAALDAVWLMSEYGWSARRVQRVRGLPHQSSVTRLVARYCGVHPVALREEGGFAAAIAHVSRVLPVDEGG